MVVGIIQELTRGGFLDDAAFAREWIQYRLDKPVGLRRIALELADKGIPKELIDAACHQAMERVDEVETVRRIAEKRAGKYGDVDPLKRKKRLMDYLARRGFDMSAIMKVISKI